MILLFEGCRQMSFVTSRTLPIVPAGISSMVRFTLSSLAALALIASPFAMRAQDGQHAKQLPPRTWVDKDTGHRVWRISDESNSGAFYFNVTAYTPDHK